MGGETESITMHCSLFESEIVDLIDAKTPEQLIKKTVTATRGLKQGSVTVVFDKNTAPENIHTRGTVYEQHKRASTSKVVPVGEPLASVKACVISEKEDISEMKKILGSLQMYVPLYDGASTLLYTQADWLNDQKK